MARKALALLALAAGWVAGLTLYRRTVAARRARVDLYFDDGSMKSIVEGSADGARLLPLAREALRAGRAA